MSNKIRFFIFALFCMTVASCNPNDQSAVDITEFKVSFSFGANNDMELNFRNLTRGEYSESHIIPTDSLSGSYCTFTNVETATLPQKLSLANYCTWIDYDRISRIETGRYILILALEPTEFLDLSLYTYESDTSNDSVSINIRNKSNQNFKDVKVLFPSDAAFSYREVNYGAVASGASSEFVNVAAAYRYAYAEIVTEDDTLRISPFDYEGEEELQPGKYSYDLDILVGEGDVSRIVQE